MLHLIQLLERKLDSKSLSASHTDNNIKSETAKICKIYEIITSKTKSKSEVFNFFFLVDTLSSKVKKKKVLT